MNSESHALNRDASAAVIEGAKDANTPTTIEIRGISRVRARWLDDVYSGTRVACLNWSTLFRERVRRDSGASVLRIHARELGAEQQNLA
jgi:hypothetical protein